ncbi:PilZ domain-containing protein [Lysobacter terrae]
MKAPFASAAMTPAVAAAHEQLFGDVLACDEVLPAAFLPGPTEAQVQRLHLAQAEGLLRALAVVEDSGRNEEADPHIDAAFRRLEAKIDLLTALVAGFAASHSVDAVRSLHWSARGARLVTDAAHPPGTRGLFRVQPAEWLPSPLVLPASVAAVESAAGGTVPQALWLRFDALGPALEAALERHLFRVHRRAVAESRRSG